MVANVNVLGPRVLDVIATHSNGTTIITIQGNLVEVKAIISNQFIAKELIPSTHANNKYKVGSAGREEVIEFGDSYKVPINTNPDNASTRKDDELSGRTDWSYMANEGEDHALVADGEAPTEFALMANTKSKVFDNSLCSNEYKELEELKLENDGLDGKLAGLLKASKNLDHLIESQRSDQVKEGVGYNDVPPPAADLYLSPKKDLSWTGLPEFVDDTVTDYTKLTPNVASTSAEVQRETYKSQNHAYMGSSHRFVGHRPHGVPMRPSHKSIGHRPHGASMKPSNRPAGHKSHGPSMNPRRPTMNGIRPYKSFFNQAPSYETRPFLKSSVVKTPYRAPWVPTVNRNNPPVNRKFSTGREIFRLSIGNFPLLAENLPLVAQKITLLIWEGREKLAVPRTTLMTKVIGTVAALGT
nr:hypothetical protein [Tanacetum cinerariifolium]